MGTEEVGLNTGSSLDPTVREGMWAGEQGLNLGGLPCPGVVRPRRWGNRRSESLNRAPDPSQEVPASPTSTMQCLQRRRGMA